MTDTSVTHKEDRTGLLKKKNKDSRLFNQVQIVTHISLILFTVILLYSFLDRQRKDINTYADHNLQQYSQYVNKQITTIIRFGKSSIKETSATISSEMISDELENPRELILPLVETTPFDSIEYIRSDGMNLMNIGQPFNASDRIYYIEGMKGITGIWNNYSPKVSSDTLLNFYTPLIYKNNIAGVITGYIEAKKQFTPLMKGDFLGEPLQGILIDKNGMLITSTIDYEFEKNFTLEKFLRNMNLSEKACSELNEIFLHPSDSIIKYTSVNGTERMIVSSIPETDWISISILPSDSFNNILFDTTQKTGSLLIHMFIILVAYIIFLLLKNSRNTKLITEANEKQLKENYDIFEKAGYGVWKIIFSSTGKTMEANDALKKILGINEMTLTPEELYYFFNNRVQKNNSSDSPTELLTPDGILKPHQITWNHPVKGKIYLSAGGSYKKLNDTDMILSGFCGDITEQVSSTELLNIKMKEALNLSETSNERLLEQTEIIGALSRIYFANYFIDLRNKTYKEILSPKDIQKILPAAGNAVDAVNMFIAHAVKQTSQQELMVFSSLDTVSERLKNVHSLSFDYESITRGWCRATWVVVSRDENGNAITVLYVVSNVDNIIKAELEQKKKLKELNDTLEEYNKELQVSKNEAEAASKAKTAFLFNMSHDIRTPMNAILGFAKLLEENHTDMSLIDNYLKKIITSGEYLLTIINNVLDMARIESGKAILDIDFCDICDTEKNAVAVFDNFIKEKNLTLTTHYDIQHHYLKLDITKLKQIWVNLISNSIKYTPSGGSISITLKEIPCSKEGYATYVSTITDTGIGMSEEFLSHLFEPFTRERNTTESRIIGTGLGMAIVKKLVDLMEGTISVESEVNKGTTFTITMSHKLFENPEEYLQKQKEKQISRTDFSGKRILLAEDNDLNAEIAITILSNAGFKIEHVKDGIECLQKLNEAEDDYYDLILMDIQMPNLNGILTTEKIRKSMNKTKANIPIIAMTANAFEEDRRMALDAGMNGHIAKPIDVAKLFETLNDIFK